MDDDINEWLKQAKDAGLSDEKITQKLLDNGWGKDKIYEFLNPNNSKSMEEQNQQQLAPQPEKHSAKNDLKKGLIIFWTLGILITLLGVYLIFNVKDDLSAIVFGPMAYLILFLGLLILVGAIFAQLRYFDKKKGNDNTVKYHYIYFIVMVIVLVILMSFIFVPA